jgi:hypothetical protein
MTELTDDDVKQLFSEGYYSIDCDNCGKPVGFIKVFSGYDYTYDETLCFDCALAKVRTLRFKQENMYV